MADIPEAFRAPVVYTLPGMDRVQVEKDIIYRGHGNSSLAMDVYRPADLSPGQTRPAVVFVHGDAPPDTLGSAKEWGQYTSWGRLAAASGLIGITFNHRSTLQFSQTDEALRDIEAALAYVRDHAADLGVDAERICFWVCSAGGFALKLVLKANPVYVRCVVAYYPVLDLPAWLSGFRPDIDFSQLAVRGNQLCHRRSTAAVAGACRARQSRAEWRHRPLRAGGAGSEHASRLAQPPDRPPRLRCPR